MIKRLKFLIDCRLVSHFPFFLNESSAANRTRVVFLCFNTQQSASRVRIENRVEGLLGTLSNQYGDEESTKQKVYTILAQGSSPGLPADHCRKKMQRENKTFGFCREGERRERTTLLVWVYQLK